MDEVRHTISKHGFPFPLVYSWVLDFGAELNLADAYNACFVRENRAGLTLMSRKSMKERYIALHCERNAV